MDTLCFIGGKMPIDGSVLDDAQASAVLPDMQLWCIDKKAAFEQPCTAGPPLNFLTPCSSWSTGVQVQLVFFNCLCI